MFATLPIVGDAVRFLQDSANEDHPTSESVVSGYQVSNRLTTGISASGIAVMSVETRPTTEQSQPNRFPRIYSAKIGQPQRQVALRGKTKEKAGSAGGHFPAARNLSVAQRKAINQGVPPEQAAVSGFHHVAASTQQQQAR